MRLLRTIVLLTERPRSITVLWTLTTAAWLLLAPAPLPAQQPASTAQDQIAATGEYWALIIGIDKYKDEGITTLTTAENDAKAIKEVLGTRYGFQANRMIELLGKEATQDKIIDKLEWLTEQTSPSDSVFVYFAGHGKTDIKKKAGWWIPVDYDPMKPSSLINTAIVSDIVFRMNARHVLLVVDSCFAGTIARRAGNPAQQAYLSSYNSPSRWALTSGGVEPVADGGKDGHSFFAYYFLKLLKDNTQPYLIPTQIQAKLHDLVGANAEQKPEYTPMRGYEGGEFVFQLVGATASLNSRASLVRELLDDARSIVLSPDHDAKALAALAKAQIKGGDLKIALETLIPLASASKHSLDIDDAFATFAIAQAKAGNLADALLSIYPIQSPYYREKVLVVWGEAKSEALKAARSRGEIYRPHIAWNVNSLSSGEAQDAFCRAMTWVLLTWDRAKTGEEKITHKLIDALLEWNDQLREQFERVQYMASIGVLQVEAGFTDEGVKMVQDAADMANLMPENNSQKSSTLAVVANAKVLISDIPGALQILPLLEEKDREEVQYRIAIKYAETGDLESSMRTARSLTSNNLFFSALNEIAAAKARKGDVKGALETIASIPSYDDAKVEGLAAITAVQVNRGDYREAEVTAKQARAVLDFSPEYYGSKVLALSHIAAALIEDKAPAISTATFLIGRNRCMY